MFRQISSPPSFLFHTSLDVSLLMYFLWDLLVTVSTVTHLSWSFILIFLFLCPRLHDDFKHHYICEFLLLLLITGVGIMDSSASQPVASVGNCGRASKIFGVQEMCRCVGEVCETGPLLDASSTVMLTSVQLLCNKVDELWASGKFLIQCNSPCVLALTKTLLRNKTDSNLEVDGFGKLFLLVRD